MKHLLLPLLLAISACTLTTAQPFGNEWIDYSKTYYKFPIRELRFYRIMDTTLQRLGLGGIPAEHFQLWRDGQEVPVFTSVSSGTFPAGGFIEFPGTPNTGFADKDLFVNPDHQTHPERSFFNDTAWYFLTVNASGINKRYEALSNNPLLATHAADSFYWHTLNPLSTTTNTNLGFSRVIGNDFIRSSTWDMSESFASTFFASARLLQYNLTGLRAFMNGPEVRVNYAVGGNTSTSRNVRVRLNDAGFDTFPVPFFNLANRSFTLPMNSIINNTINFKFNSDNPISWENVTVNRMVLTYPRTFFHNTALPLPLRIQANNAGNFIKIAGIPTTGGIPAILYDLNNLHRISGTIKGDTNMYLLSPSGIERDILIGAGTSAGTSSGIRNISTITPVTFRNFALSENQGDYLIISHRFLRMGSEDQVEAYRQYRSSTTGGGYNAKIYDIDELADQFIYGGRKNPLAIRRFILYAMSNFSQTPKMVFLMGRGATYINFTLSSSSIKEFLNLVPSFGHPSSDNLLASKDNLRPVPELPIGRISALSPAEVKIYLEKVKEFEALQQKRPVLPSDNEWRKHIVHLIGGDDQYLADSILARYMRAFGTTISGPLVGAKVQQFSRPGNPNIAEDMKTITSRLSEGVGLITYFGHSSTSSIDFNLGSPKQFDNTNGKYSFFLANGCRAGNIFDLNFNRLNSPETSISENFILANKKGSVAFISNSDLGAINYQNLMTSEWYKAMAEGLYGKTIGEIQLEALSKAFDRTGSSDFINRCNLEQSILHADPALKLFTARLPDYATEASAIETNPARVYTESDTMALDVKFFNLGTYSSTDSVLLQLHREMPDGNRYELYRKKVLAGPIRDSISFSFGIKGLFEEGTNYIIATIDGDTQYNEQDEDNNIAVLPMNIERRYIQPVYPYDFSIINDVLPVLKASTSNPTEPEKAYTFQIDTTKLFNSPTLQEWQVISPGGILETTPPSNLISEQVYYWRVYPTAPVVPASSAVFSFNIHSGSTQTGFIQSHFYQKQSITGSMRLNEARDYEFAKRENTLFVSHGIFPISGTEDSHFSVTHNGLMKMASACLGRSIIFHVFDSLSFEPWRNVPTRFGSATSCAPLRDYNYEFRYAPLSARKTIMDFLDSIPNGNFVAARLVLDAPYDSALVRFWQNDTTTFGPGISLYHKLKNLGFRDIDSMNRYRTFFFFFKKGDTTSYSPYTQFSDGLFDRLNAGIFPKTPDTTGKMTSPWMGPAKTWDEARWLFTKHQTDSALGNIELKLWGRHKSGTRELLFTSFAADSAIDISGINAEDYPYIQYEMSASGYYGSKPAQLNYWRLYYEPFPDGALSRADSFYFYNDTLKPGLDTLRIALAFKNISKHTLSGTKARLFLLSASGSEIPLGTQDLRQLNPEDTAMIWLEQELALPAGTYSLRIAVNEAGNPTEENFFNNLAVVKFEVIDKPLPVKLLLFNAAKKDQDALLTWEARETNDLLYFAVEHSTSGADFKEIGRVNASQPNQQSFSFTHRQPGSGLQQYRLKMVEKSQQIAYSDIKKLNFNWSDKLKLVPNPFNQYFTVVPANPLKTWQLVVRDAAGKLVLTQKGSGQQKIDMGQFASGVYFAEWISENYRTSQTIVKQ